MKGLQSMKKILFLIPSLGGGGAEKVLVNLVNRLNAEKYEITVRVLFDSDVNKSSLKPHIKYQYTFGRAFRGNVHLMKLFSPETLYKCFVKEHYDIVISYLEGVTARIVAGCNRTDTKIINWVHNEFHDIRKISKVYRSKREALRCHLKYDATVFVADSARQAFAKAMPALRENLYTLYNTLDSEAIAEKANEKTEEGLFSEDAINLISVGRFAPQKAFDRLIRIANKLIKEDKLPVKLYLLGSGSLYKKYRAQIAQYGIQDSVIFLGYRQNPYKYVKRADVFVCSSLHEGYSTAVSESLIVGMPVITTRCSGMEELLGENDTYGIITENSEAALYIGLKELLRQKEKMAHYKSRAQIRGKAFDAKAAVTAIEDFLEKI